MSYQSEAQLEAQLIEQLQSQNYTKVVVPDYDSLLANFKTQFERFNTVNLGGKPLSAKEWERVLNYVNGKSIFESAKILRDKFVLELDDASKVYVALLDEDLSKICFFCWFFKLVLIQFFSCSCMIFLKLLLFYD